MIEAAPYLITPWLTVGECSFQGLATILAIIAIWIFRRDLKLKKPSVKHDYISVYWKKVKSILKSIVKKSGRK